MDGDSFPSFTPPGKYRSTIDMTIKDGDLYKKYFTLESRVDIKEIEQSLIKNYIFLNKKCNLNKIYLNG